MVDLKKNEFLEVIENLLAMSARKEAEVAELKAQLDVFKPKDFDLKIIEDDNLRHGSIMLVFQSKMLADILKTMLEKTGGYDVKIVERYEDAASEFAISNSDICVIEHSPYGEGQGSVRFISELRAMSKIVGIISVMPENDVDLIREVVNAGVDDFLVKPIDTRRMTNVIYDIVAKKKQRKTG